MIRLFVAGRHRALVVYPSPVDGISLS